jgi:murein DD-endopeptidase MepM/ murein hydrolase activator NlpD
MFRNARFFVYSNSSLDLREVRFFKTKLAASGAALGLVLLALLFLGNILLRDVLGFGYGEVSMLVTENKILKDQVREMGRKMQVVQRTLEGLAERGNELRVSVDLKRIDDDTRSASTGGTREPSTSAFLTGEAGALLTHSQSLIDRLTREVRLQQQSYEEIQSRLKYNKEYFAHIPAIKPMAGPYSINGFGMRLHPVLHIYRMHYGVDIINDVGTNVYASADGIVHFSGRTQGGLGIVVELDHGYGFNSVYGHLSQVLVPTGKAVKRGDLIGKCGRTGLVSGPHLHYEVRRTGVSQNPVDYFFDDVDAARYRALLAQAGSRANEQ